MNESLKNIFTVSDLRKRVFYTLGLLAVYRVGHHITIPGVDNNAVLQFAESLKNTMFGLYDMLWKGFQRPKRLEFERETLTDRFGRFYAQPFERGFGTTIGNALRRVLLSSIEGAAITAVKIDGVLHEFSPIPGVVEDATDIILNLKQIPLKLHSDQTKTLTLRVDKAGEVRARDIQADGDVEILEPDAHIATVADHGKLHMR